MEEEMGRGEMLFNHTTPSVSPSKHTPEFPAYGVLIVFMLLTLTGCAVAVVLYIRRKTRFDELRHRLIPLYTYDPAEEEEWGDADGDDEEVEATKPLNREGALSFPAAYGNR